MKKVKNFVKMFDTPKQLDPRSKYFTELPRPRQLKTFFKAISGVSIPLPWLEKDGKRIVPKRSQKGILAG